MDSFTYEIKRVTEFVEVHNNKIRDIQTKSMFLWWAIYVQSPQIYGTEEPGSEEDVN